MSKDHDHHHHQKSKRALHKDWRAWGVVLLMVGLIFAYLASRDEQDAPADQGQPQIAAPAP